MCGPELEGKLGTIGARHRFIVDVECQKKCDVPGLDDRRDQSSLDNSVVGADSAAIQRGSDRRGRGFAHLWFDSRCAER